MWIPEGPLDVDDAGWMQRMLFIWSASVKRCPSSSQMKNREPSSKTETVHLGASCILNKQVVLWNMKPLKLQLWNNKYFICFIVFTLWLLRLAEQNPYFKLCLLCNKIAMKSNGMTNLATPSYPRCKLYYD